MNTLLRSWRVILAVLALALLTGAGAADTGCATLADQSGAGASRVNLETFVPDPICWLRSTSATVKSAGLYTFTRSLALALIVLAAAVGLLQYVQSHNKTMLGQRLILCVLCFGATKDYGSAGLGWQAYGILRTGWNATYNASSQVGQGMLNQNFIADANRLASKAMQFSVIDSQLRLQRITQSGSVIGYKAGVPGMDRDSLNAVYDAVAEEKRRQFSGASAGAADFGSTALASLGYWLTIGLFSVFGIMIYSSGFLVLTIGILLPVGIALAAFGRVQGTVGMALLGIGAVASVAMLPIVVGLVTKTMLTAPVQSMAQSLDWNIDQGKRELNTLITTVDRCGLNALCTAGATTNTAAGNIAQGSFLGFGFGTVLSLGLAFLSTLAAFAIAMTQLRRIPAIIGQVLGTGGGGESTGAWQPKSGGLRLPSGGGSASASTPPSSASSVRVIQESKGQALPAPRTGGVSAGPPALTVTARVIQERKSLPPPK